MEQVKTSKDISKLTSPLSKATITGNKPTDLPLKAEKRPSGILLKKEEKKVNYFTYNKLVGESDGGNQLPQKEYKEILQKYHDSWQNRLYVHFARLDGTKECVRVKPPCQCFCGHHFKSHEWWDTENKKVKCRTPGCNCGRYRGSPDRCSKAGCNCEGFITSFSCQCGGMWSEHDTIVETEQERRSMGKQVDTDVVKQRLKEKSVEGCGKCMGCKNRMACYYGKK